MPRIPVSTKCRQQTADRIQNIDCRLQSGYKMQTKNLKSFYVWYIITCHLTAYRASRNRFSAIRLHDYLHYCGIFLAHFLMKIDGNIISSLHIVFSLSASWLVWCLYTDVLRICFNGSEMTTCLRNDQINDKRKTPILSEETFFESAQLFKNFRGLPTSHDTTREIWSPKGGL